MFPKKTEIIKLFPAGCQTESSKALARTGITDQLKVKDNRIPDRTG